MPVRKLYTHCAIIRDLRNFLYEALATLVEVLYECPTKLDDINDIDGLATRFATGDGGGVGIYSGATSIQNQTKSPISNVFQ